jgi:hypothetical protein
MRCLDQVNGDGWDCIYSHQLVPCRYVSNTSIQGNHEDPEVAEAAATSEDQCQQAKGRRARVRRMVVR